MFARRLFAGSLRIWSLFGIDVFVHWSFLLLLALAAAEGAHYGGDRGALRSLGFILFVFLFVYLHELGHSFAARREGLPIDRIILWPVGGLAVIGEAAPTPGAALRITISGPAVNFFFALIAYLLLRFLHAAPLDAESFHFGEVLAAGSVLAMIFLVNLGLGLFNLLPMFPLDGGHILRALLAYRMGGRRATRAACRVGMVVAVPVIFLGLYLREFLLTMIGLGSLLICIQMSRRAGEQATYTGETSWRAGGAGEFSGDAWREATRPARPGFFARLGARRRERRERARREKEEEIRRRVDLLLDKVARDGTESLTRKEKDFLRRASELYRESGARKS